MPESNHKIPFGKPRLKKELTCQEVEELLKKKDLSLGEQLNTAKHCSKCPNCEEKFGAKLQQLAKES